MDSKVKLKEVADQMNLNDRTNLNSQQVCIGNVLQLGYII